MERSLEQLRSARRRKGLSQADVADRIGTTQSAIARLEAAVSDPRLSTVERYAEAVGARVAVVPAESPSLAQSARDVRATLSRDDADEALRTVIQFVDDLRGLDPELRRQAVLIEPETTGDRRWDALLAGVAEYSGLLFGFAVPGWAAAPSRFLNRFWFVIEDVLGRPAPGLAALAFVTSPPSLAIRGVFLDRATLVSV